jgi:AcrR family transcriptional regulator
VRSVAADTAISGIIAPLRGDRLPAFNRRVYDAAGTIPPGSTFSDSLRVQLDLLVRVQRNMHRRAPTHNVNVFYMKWSRRAEPRGYHHGNLKETLVRAALELIAEKGPAGFTFADAARWAGVSPAAPYRHFRDRDELLSDVARRGFEQFTTVLTRAWDNGNPDVNSAFDRLGKAYLNFAKREPAFYSAMFEGGVPHDSDPQLREAGERAFAVLRGAAEKLVAQMPAAGRPPALMVALHVWSLSHGIASLFSRGDAARRALPMPPEELLEAGFLIYLRGLGLPAR